MDGGVPHKPQHLSTPGASLLGPLPSLTALADGAWSRLCDAGGFDPNGRETVHNGHETARHSTPGVLRPYLRGNHPGCVERREGAGRCEFDGRFSVAVLGSRLLLYARANIVGQSISWHEPKHPVFGGRHVQAGECDRRRGASPSSSASIPTPALTLTLTPHQHPHPHPQPPPSPSPSPSLVPSLHSSQGS